MVGLSRVGVMVAALCAAGVAHGKGKSSGGSSSGPLSQTASGVSARTGSSSSGGSGSSSSSSSSSSSDDDWDPGYDWDDDDDGYGYGYTQYGGTRPSLQLRPPGATPPAMFLAKPDFELSFTGMNVMDSGGAFDINASAQSGYLRVVGGNASFFEEQNDDTLVVNIYRAGLGFALGGPEAQSRVFIDGGISGFESPSDSLLGAMAAVEVRHRLAPKVWVDGLVRGYWMEAGVRALDASAGVRLSVVRFGYRHLDFNVGPPLHGPELGLSFSF